MTAYYNEIDPFAAQWLRNLIDAGHIAAGDVDERSIVEVQPDDVRGYTQCHFFAGIGVWSHALRLAGWPDDRSVWTGSCPCQPFSKAGPAAGTDDPRHLWPEWYRLIRQCGPTTVFGEQVAGRAGLAWLDLVSADMEASSYAIGAADLCAAGIGAPHKRQRLFFVADSGRGSVERPRSAVGRTSCSVQREARQQRIRADLGHGGSDGGWRCEWVQCRDGKARPVEPGTFPLVDGDSEVLAELRAYGNAIVPDLAATFIGAADECLS